MNKSPALRARRLFMVRDFRGAIREADAAEALGAESAELMILKARALQLLDEPGDLREVARCLEAAIAIAPENVDAELEYGWFLLNVMDDSILALDHFVRSIQGLKTRIEEALDGAAKSLLEIEPTRPIEAPAAQPLIELCGPDELATALGRISRE